MTNQLKISTFILLVVMPLLVASQTINDYSSLTKKSGVKTSKESIDFHIERAMREISKSPKLFTNILIDKSIFNKSILGLDTVSHNFNIWQQILFSVSNGNLEEEDLYLDYANKIKEHNSITPDIVNIGVINYKFDKIKDDAFGKGMLYLKDGVIHEAGLYKNCPYETIHIVSASLLKKELFANQEISVLLNNEFCFTDNRVNIDQIEIDLDDGNGFKQIGFNQTINVQYEEIGRKTIRFRFYTGKSGLIETQSEVDVLASSAGNIPKGAWMVPPTKSAKPNNTDSSSVGEASLFSLNDFNSLDKPVVIIEGFDYRNEVNTPELINKYNNYQLVSDLINHPDGYDVLTVNFVNHHSKGEPDLIVYSRIIDSLLYKIKQITNNNIVIVAGGTGALATRHALTKSENEGRSHNVNLFISIDCPNQGANIALGNQFWAQDIENQGFGANRICELIDSDVARQILVYHKDAILNSVPQPDPKFAMFFDSLKGLGNNGYPVNNIRKVAISNGSGLGSYLFNEGEPIVNWEFQENYLYYYGKVNSLNLSSSTEVYNSKFSVITGKVNECTVDVHSTYNYDNIAGSYLDISTEIQSAISCSQEININNEYQCFVPVFSAFDIPLVKFSGNALSGSKMNETPFDSLYCNNYNNFHLEINQENSNWIYNEICGNANKGENIGKSDFADGTGYNDDHTYQVNYNSGLISIHVLGNKTHIPETKFEILNCNGQYLKEVNMIGQKCDIDISCFPKGIYFLKSSSNLRETHIYKIVNM